MAPRKLTGQIILGHYEVLSPLGDGGQAYVYQGRDQATGQAVAIKHLAIVPGEDGYSEQLAAVPAGRTTADRPSPRRGPPWRWGKTAVSGIPSCPISMGRRWTNTSMPRAESWPRMRRFPLWWEWPRAWKPSMPGTSSIADFKPENVLVGSDRRPYIIDLGVYADLRHRTIAGQPGLTGTLTWMSPEHLADRRNAGSPGPTCMPWARSAI